MNYTDMENVTAAIYDSNITSNITTNADLNISKEIKLVLDVFTVSIVLIIMTAMGTDISWKQIWEHIRIPFGPIIGLLCQFVLMPLVGFAYNKIFQFESRIAAGLLIISCCPGGAISNTFTYYLEGDVSLSVTMTTISTILGLGMMPLNVWLYASSSEASKIVIPYENMAVSLIMITSPVILGMIIKWKLPKVAIHITKWGSALGFLLIVIILIIDFVVFRQALHQVTWKLIVTALIMPITGILLGYTIAFVCRRPYSVCKTIAIESGIQNVAVAFSVIMLSFDIRKYVALLLIPWFYGISQFVLCGVLSFVYHFSRYMVKKKETSEDEVKKDTEKKEVTSL